MTTKRDLKSIIRERQRKTGESCTAARVHVLRERAQLLGIPDEPEATEPPALVAALLDEMLAASGGPLNAAERRASDRALGIPTKKSPRKAR